MPGLVAAGSFLVGIFVGVLIRDAFEIYATGKGYVVSDTRKLTRRAARSRTFGITLVVLALIANALAGFLLIATRAAQSEQAERLEQLAVCAARYNVDLGRALEERDAAIGQSSDEEIGLWAEYVRLFELAKAADSRGDEAELTRLQVRFYDRVSSYVGKLRELRETRAANPYPDPERCRRPVASTP